MTGDGLAALAHDAAQVVDALATMKWFLRGVTVGAGTPAQAAFSENVARIVERAEGTANVVASEIARERDAEGGDPE